MYVASKPDDMEYAVLGWPDDGPKIRLDYERFSYAGKFVMSNTGKAVVRAERPSERPPVSFGDESVVAAIAFNEDRTDDGTMWLRYVTVHADRRGEGIGPKLARFTTERIHDRGYHRVKIAVNNPYAYQALYRAGFGFTGEDTGLAELVLEHPRPVAGRERYQDGLDRYRERDLSSGEQAFLASKEGATPPRE
ncbi:GCN5-related N-acetyltransferase [Haladaptatus paucihalophilus DX253]|uniref:Acetyltransferase (GNAT) family protein n=2 Tax=Haladaptataceae TaxID=3064797 RepID=E7QRT7_HALPU|nr:GCN5-related N-acetyltransferase [Haladaptatus paucihalophilus DX253]GKZ13696.1 N-acetyltransferase [Haladaptatus sp. T7]SHK15106.1 Acetyltransferase (GNAT) family protein [Haladaptatus paucihalophilus DX253]